MKMSDMTDDMESDAAKIFCRKCKEHFESCGCETECDLVELKLV